VTVVTVRGKKNVNGSVQLPRDGGRDMCRCPTFESEEQGETGKVRKRKDCGVVKEGIGSIHESSWSCDRGWGVGVNGRSVGIVPFRSIS
jgi:hypothetical protein